MRIRVRVPASTANVGCGYDTFGLALGYYNYVEAEEASTSSITIVGHGEQHLPRDERNLVRRAAQAVCDMAGYHDVKLALTAYNNIPLSRGMGSSSAAIIGGLYAANQLLGLPLNNQTLLSMAAEIEGHPDNVAPALLGGFVIVAQEDGLHTRKIRLPREMGAVLAVPSFTVSTKKARDIMPETVPLTDAVYNVSHAAYLVAALMQHDLPAFGSMLRDRLHQPYRATLIPGAEQIMAAAMAAGALGCVISGSGPTMIAFFQGGKEEARAIGKAMRQASRKHQGADPRIIRARLDNRGAQIEKRTALI